MKIMHKGHTITAVRERDADSTVNLLSSIVRDSDGYVCHEQYGDSTWDGTLDGEIEYLKRRIDEETVKADPWGQQAEYDEEARILATEAEKQRTTLGDVHEIDAAFSAYDGPQEPPMQLFGAGYMVAKRRYFRTEADEDLYDLVYHSVKHVCTDMEVVRAIVDATLASR